jgi:hypothetical protein
MAFKRSPHNMLSTIHTLDSVSFVAVLLLFVADKRIFPEEGHFARVAIISLPFAMHSSHMSMKYSLQDISITSSNWAYGSLCGSIHHGNFH